MSGSTRCFLRGIGLVCALGGFLLVPVAASTSSPPAYVRAARSTRRARQDNTGECGPVRVFPGRRKATARCPAAGSSSGVAKGDFNGDGFADLAIGVPGEDTPTTQPDSGAVNVIYGSGTGLTATDSSVPAAQFWSQNAPGVPDVSEAGDRFGSALASGDFNGDGFSDLAIGVPNDVVDSGNVSTVGRVVVIFGSAAGLTTDSSRGVPAAQSFSLVDLDNASPGQVLSFGPTADLFGSSLSWGDFDGDGVGDLAIGAPHAGVVFVEQFEARTSGIVGVLYGVRNVGLTTTREQIFCQCSQALNLPASELGHADDLFGAALTSGDFDGDRRSDLAIGIPSRDVNLANDAGEILVLKGGSSGLSSQGFGFFSRFTSSVIDEPNARDRFGWSLAAGDMNGDGRSDLAVGVPFDDVGGTADAGSVQFFFGGTFGILADGNTVLTQSLVFGVNSVQEANDAFGFSLASGDFNGDARADLAIGVPFEDFGTTIDVGEVDVIYGSSSGLSRTAGPGSQGWHQGFGGVPMLEGTAEAHDRFGLTLTAWNFGRNFTTGTNPPKVFKYADLAIGVPFEELYNEGTSPPPVASGGAVNVIYGSRGGLTVTGNQVWWQDSDGVPGTANPGDTFGLGLY